jgi:hypothetical protein
VFKLLVNGLALHSRYFRAPGRCQSHYQRARARAASGNNAGAIEDYSAAIALAKEGSSVYLERGGLEFFNNEDWPRAEQDFTAAIERGRESCAQPRRQWPRKTADRRFGSRLCENAARYNRTRNFETCGHAHSKKTQKFILRSALRPNQISFSHSLGQKQTPCSVLICLLSPVADMPRCTRWSAMGQWTKPLAR